MHPTTTKKVSATEEQTVEFFLNAKLQSASLRAENSSESWDQAERNPPCTGLEQGNPGKSERQNTEREMEQLA